MTISSSPATSDETTAVEVRTCACSPSADDGAASHRGDDGAAAANGAALREGMDGLSRRHVLAGLGAIGAAATLAACSSPSQPAASPDQQSTDTAAEPGVPGVVAKVADVPVGGAIAAQLDGTPVIIAQPEEGTFVGISAICTHQGCTVAPDGAELSCPCHGSTFSLAGAVNQGPATEDLPTFTVTVEGDDLVAAL